MVKKSKQQTERLLYREGLYRSNDMNEGIYRSSSRTPYTSNDLDKEGYSAPFIPRSTSYVDYSKQYFSKSDASKSSANADAFSSPQRSLSPASPIVATYDYSPFGQLIATSGTPELSPIQFSSEVFDPETALTYYNHRYYNPTDGRWLSRDPAEESASLNLYAFVNNSPNYRIDYLGLEKFKIGPTIFKESEYPPVPPNPLIGIIYANLFGSRINEALRDIVSYGHKSDSLADYFLARYLSGIGGTQYLDIKDLYEKEPKFRSRINAVKKEALIFIREKNAWGKEVSLTNWEQAPFPTTNRYIYSLGGYSYTATFKATDSCLVEVDIVIKDYYDFDHQPLPNGLRELGGWAVREIACCIFNPLDYLYAQPFRVLGRQKMFLTNEPNIYLFIDL